MIIGILVQLVVLGGIVTLLVLAVRRIREPVHRPRGEGQAARRFFQYALLLAATTVTAVGVAGLLGQVFDRSMVIAADPTETARNVTFTVVGLPVLVVIGVTSRRLLRRPEERAAVAWAGYLTVAGLTALALVMVSAHQTLAWLIGQGPRDGHALARAVVWAALWAGHWQLARRVPPPRPLRWYLLLGSLVGLAVSVLGVVGLVGGLVEFAFDGDGARLLGGSPVLDGVITLLVGVPVWGYHWWWRARRLEPDEPWKGYVLLVGLGASLAFGVVSVSRVGFDLLVWWVGQPDRPQASAHFEATPDWLAAAAVCAAIWWYHRQVLEAATAPTRTEVHRVHEYLMAGIGLVTMAGGVTLLVTALVEVVSGTAVLVGGAVPDALLAAVVVLTAGTLVWVVFWRCIEAAVLADPAQERSAVTRRTYLALFTGCAGLVALAALLAAVFVLLEAVFGLGLGVDTIRRMRVPVGLIVAAGAIAGWHGRLWWRERTIDRNVSPRYRHRFVLLLGPRDRELARSVAHRAGTRVQSWARTDQVEPAWTADEVLALLDRVEGDGVVVLREPDGLHAIPIQPD